jgi:hypothetical protein
MMMWVSIGVIFSILVGVVVYFIMGRAETRPITSHFMGSKEGFYGGAITGTSGLPCGRVSSEAEELYSLFSIKKLSVGEEGLMDLHDLRNLLSKLACFKSDLMSPGQTIMAVKELGFSTHTDIQPVADLTGRCFSKTIPERDLSIQFEKWRDSGIDLIRRLCTASSMSEQESSRAEKLFFTFWKDVQNVAQTSCLTGPPEAMYKTGPHEPAANIPEQLKDLRPYDGLY